MFLKIDVFVLILDGFSGLIGFFLLFVKDEFIEFEVEELRVLEEGVFEDVKVFVNFSLVMLRFGEEVVK